MNASAAQAIGSWTTVSTDEGIIADAALATGSTTNPIVSQDEGIGATAASATGSTTSPQVVTGTVVEVTVATATGGTVTHGPGIVVSVAPAEASGPTTTPLVDSGTVTPPTPPPYIPPSFGGGLSGGGGGGGGTGRDRRPNLWDYIDERKDARILVESLQAYAWSPGGQLKVIDEVGEAADEEIIMIALQYFNMV